MKTKRLYIVVSNEFDEKLSSWSNRLGVSKNQLATMAAQAGMDNIIRAIAPVESIPVDLMAKLMEALEKRGYDAEKLKSNLEEEKKYVTVDVIPTKNFDVF